MFGDGGGYDTTGDSAASDWADFAVGFQEGDDACGGKGVKGISVDAGCGEVGEDAGKGLECVRVSGDDTKMFVAFPSRARAAVSRCVGEDVFDVLGDVVGSVGVNRAVGRWWCGRTVGRVFEQVW